APRDGTRLRELLREAVAVDDAPTVVRFAKGAVPADVDAIDTVGTADVLARGESDDVLVLAAGSMVPVGLGAAERLSAEGLGVTVVDPRWVKPFDPAVVALAASHRLVVTIEDNGRIGGVGAAFTQALRDVESDVPVRVHGVAQEFLDHAKRPVILERLGLTPDAVAADTRAAWQRVVGNNLEP
ncbi:transketolase C-terminal domain-containing protein, partial [Aeromicrobium sp. Leaf272]